MWFHENICYEIKNLWKNTTTDFKKLVHGILIQPRSSKEIQNRSRDLKLLLLFPIPSVAADSKLQENPGA